MSTVPWRVAAQAYTVLNPETKEPLMTLQFIVDHQQADVARLRIVPAQEGSESAPAIEVEFATGGYPAGGAVLQPRYLKAFERPMPVSGEQRVALAKRREAWLGDRDADERVDGSYAYREPSDADLKAWEEAHPEPKEGERRVGPDGVADGEERPGPDGKVVEAHEKAAAAKAQTPPAPAAPASAVNTTTSMNATPQGAVDAGAAKT